MEFLGSTLDEIAHEKAGIIKKSVPVIIGESDLQTDNIFIKIAERQSSTIYFAEKKYSAGHSIFSDDEIQIFNIEKENQIYYPSLKTDLLGIYQKRLKKIVKRGINNLEGLFKRYKKFRMELDDNGSDLL